MKEFRLKKIHNYCSILVFCLLSSLAISQNKTVIRGHVIDAKTQETLPYINIQLDGTTEGTTSDIEGNFYMETSLPTAQKIKISCVGYVTQFLAIKVNEINELKIALEDNTVNLTEVIVRPKKYRNKGNPAVELIENVIKNKSKNRPEKLDFYSYRKHEKTSFALNNVTEKTKKSAMFKKLQFVFEKADTNKASGKVNLPLFLRENISDVYFRKSPKDLREYIRGEKMTNVDGFFDAGGISDYLTNMYQDINFYENAIDLMTIQFISPLSPISPNVYRFYIQDTTLINGTKCVHLYFAPRNKTDLAFMGHLWVALDSSYAVRKIEAGIPKDINLNWVKAMQISQQYDWVSPPSVSSDSMAEHRALMLTKDDMLMDFGVFQQDSTRSILGTKTVTYANYTINEAIEDRLFKNGASVWRDPNSERKDEAFWVENRLDTLTTREKNIYQIVDTLNKNSRFSNIIRTIRLIYDGFFSYKKIELTSVMSLISFNPIEGTRLRFGGRTSPKFSNSVLLEGYAAYGTKDDRWKGMMGIRYNFGKEPPLRFPLHQWRVWAEDEIRIPGQDALSGQSDNLFASFQRGVNDKMWYVRTFASEYMHEYPNHFSFDFSAKNITFEPVGALRFNYTIDNNNFIKQKLTTTEFGTHFRYAPNEKFYQGPTFRTPILTKYPLFDFWYSAGVKDVLGSEYNYHTVRFKGEKVFYLSPIGMSDVIVEAGRTFGKVPYPLLFIHRANQTYAFQAEPYNLMNFMEFVSDKFVSLNVTHNFGGVFLNRFPLIKKLKLREVMTFKALWGGLDASNLPDNHGDGLFSFPTQADGTPLSYQLSQKPYMEASVGISNLFRVLRIDYVQRLSYLENPNVSKWGIRLRLKLEY